jgi:hypothetical protein
MLVSLTVYSKNFKDVSTVYTESFESTRIMNLRANQNTHFLSGISEFSYVNDWGRDVQYTVLETVADITNMTGGLGSAINFGAAAADWTAEEFGNGTLHTTVITNNANWVKAIASAALAFGDAIYTFPLGGIRILGATYAMTVAAPASVATPEIGLGTVLAAGANATLGAAGNTTEDITDGTAMGAISAVGTAVAVVKLPEADVTNLDGHTTAIPVFLNIAGNWATTENLTISGVTVTITWAFLGDV